MIVAWAKRGCDRRKGRGQGEVFIEQSAQEADVTTKITILTHRTNNAAIS